MVVDSRYGRVLREHSHEGTKRTFPPASESGTVAATESRASARGLLSCKQRHKDRSLSWIRCGVMSAEGLAGYGKKIDHRSGKVLAYVFGERMKYYFNSKSC